MNKLFLDDYVGLRCKLLNFCELGWVFKIGDDRPFSTIAGKVIGRCLPSFTLNERRAPVAGIVAGGCLDLDDISAHVSQRLTDPWAGENAREVQNLQTFVGKSTHRATFRDPRWLTGLEKSLQTGLRPSEDECMHVVRTLIGIDDFKVNHVSHNRVLVGNTIATQHVPRGTRYLQRFAARIALYQTDEIWRNCPVA